MNYYYDYGYDASTYSNSYDGLDSAIATGIGATIGSFLGFISVISIVVGVLQIIAMWKLYNKAGEKGWKSIIPIYNLVVLFKISGISPWLLLVYLAGFIPFAGWIAIMALNAYQCYNLSKSFGKDIGYTFGLFFLPTIFYMILGFGQAEYVGPAGKSSVEASVMSDSDSVVETKKVEETKDSVANENTTDNKE